MPARQEGSYTRLKVWACLILVGGAFILGACAKNSRTLDPTVLGPQVIVNPDSIRLGVAKVMATNIVFEGAGFKPGDSAFITLIGPNQVKAIVAEAKIQPDGTFKALVSPLSKVMEILRGDIGFNEKFQNVVIITQPPIPAGVYTVKVTSMLSNLTAECKMTISGPSVIDRLKDWIGSLTGKIKYKKAKQ